MSRMKVRSILEIIAGVALILFGIMFFAYLGTDISSLVTDVIFVGAGVILIRRAVKSSAQNRVHLASDQRNNLQKKNKQKP